jgi:hypothetical protein
MARNEYLHIRACFEGDPDESIGRALPERWTVHLDLDV